ncbi:hypothetical protein PFICI_08721 [Pestalotiopsis fici W106-1]|uniref:CENP-C homolog n=1 Tax=Pestalotiopsis fici (strain W106-1 / CGMCC3.15140) TaxID=1229662 RepID=W3WYB4_PESFW|nr:uncharacterized protein PFICI_08721 [Pestalotiopsis fici W106-1]ETS78868.1 hypothetical protein PFICI_08721 [Pestalotiopsis fici W106-1]
MPPRPQAQRRNPQAQNEQVYELGVQGRKTGVTLTDTGERDEYGMEPADNIFSSDPESEDEQDMDIDEASTMGPATVSRKARERLSIPKARSPGKTFLNSPARHNPHVARTSSPIRGSYAEDGEEQPSPAKSPKRLLDFSKSPKRKPVANGHSQAKSSSQFAKGASQASKALGTKPSRVNGYVHNESDEEPTPRRKKQRSPEVEEEEEDEEEEEEEDEPMDFLNADGDDVEQDSIRDESPEEEDVPEEEESEEEPAPVEKPQPKKRGRKPKAVSPPVEEESEPEPEPARDASEEHEEPSKKKRGRPGKRPLVEEAEPLKPAKRPKGRPSLTKNKDRPDQGTSSAAEVRNVKKAKAAPKPSESKAKAPQAPQAVAAKAKPGRKPKMTDVDAEDPGAVPRRPPMPKRRSLVSQRRDEFEVKTTRSGRVSTKPLEFWRGERYDYDEEEDDEEVIEDKNGRRIKIGSKIKGVVRVEYDEDQPKRRRGRPASGSGSGGPGRRHKRRVSEIEEEEEEERQEWEDEPGRMIGECIYWHPEYELNPPHDDDQVEVAEEELAISESAIQMKDIKDATFRFAKTMTLPFFGSGIVDLPPQSEKRTKNARKMQMVFFVHYGNVEVTVASTTFRISKGGTFFVPRGNHYSIKNDTDRPSRLFFCQGCEVAPPPADSQEM